MRYRNCTIGDVQLAADRANREMGYRLTVGGNGLLKTSSYDKGARRSRSGRRQASACWHAYRDVLAALFLAVPDAKVSSDYYGKVVYDGARGFLDTYPDTGERNIGSLADPLDWREGCDCDNDTEGPLVAALQAKTEANA